MSTEKPLADLSIPQSYGGVPPAAPAGLAFNVAQLYTRMASLGRHASARLLDKQIVPASVDPITDIFKTMHVAAVVHSRLEATAPWGLMRGAQIEEHKHRSV
jgi:hypothetical protein